MKKKDNLIFGIFTKLSFAFILVGLVPLLVISRFFLGQFTENINDIVLDNANMMLQSSSTYVDMMLEEWEESMRQLYTNNVEPGVYLGDILLDDEIQEKRKRLYIRKFLADFDSVNGVKSVRFLDTEGNLYYSSETVGKIINSREMELWKKEEMKKRNASHDTMLESVHKDAYFSNINDQVITIKKNLFNTSSLKTVDNVLGTFYMDISIDVVGQQLSEIKLGNQSGFYIIGGDGAQIYKSKGQTSIPEDIRKKLIDYGNGIQEDEQNYYCFKKNVTGGWISMIRIHKEDMQKNVDKTRQYIFTLLGVSMFALLVLYLIFSRKISAPIYKLKEGMEKIQEGNLDTRVKINSKDEVGILAEGLNQMASQLSTYIDRVYGAEIKQREAELNALKSQIKPHYLYNTLDVIRMIAIENQDRQAAEMIESLARQLRYLMGQEGEMVRLEQELGNIQDYFMIIQIRYENRIELKISVAEKIGQKSVLKLILQPVVENAVKHGLRPKMGSGNVWISASIIGDILELTVMDDGVGMDESTLMKLKERLADRTLRKTGQEQEGGVGLCNVEDRIKNKYGDEYGMSIESTLGTGTIVILHLPVYKEERKE